jgi:opacity protein-like surface antigen
MNRPRSWRLAGAMLALVLVIAAVPAPAAAHSWIFRPITLPRGSAALDLGFAIGRLGDPERRTGPGLNLELAFAIASDVQLGLRTGIRFGGAGRATRADEYARIFETETYATAAGGVDTVANPEISMLFALARGRVVQLAFDMRFFVPLESGSQFGVMPALPIWLRFGAVRLDTGIYVPIIFTDPQTTTVVSVPLAVWIQASGRVHVGPQLGIRVWNTATDSTFTTYPFGFGLGYEVSHNVDLRFRIFFRDVGRSDAARDFGAGIAFQFRT